MDFGEKLATEFPLMYNHKLAVCVEADSGWDDIIFILSLKIEKECKKLIEETGDCPVVLQIKEKFGTLRFYMSYYTDEIEELIKEAEEQSAKTCELCGKEGRVGIRNGWWVTRCQDCAPILEVEY